MPARSRPADGLSAQAAQKRGSTLRHRRAWYIVLLAVYWVALFAGTHYPDVPQLAGDSSDKWLHGLAFLGLSLLLSATMAPRRSLTWRRYLQVILMLGIYGAVDELTQPPFGRHCELSDWMADMTGALLGLAIVAAVSRLGRRNARAAGDSPDR